MARRLSKFQFHTITRQYGLHLRRVKPYRSLYKSTAAYRATTEEGIFVIKPFYKSKVLTKLTTKQQIIRISAYVKMLQEQSYPHLPRWLSTSSGRMWVSRRGRPYYMMEWVEGNRPQHAQDFEQLGRALAVLHTCCQGILPPTPLVTHKVVQHLFQQDAAFRRQLPALRRSRRRASWFRTYGTQCTELAAEAQGIINNMEIQQLLNEETYRPTLIHGDITSPNVIMSPNGLYLIDWDQVRIDSAYYEITKTLFNTTHFNLAHIEALLQGYGQVKPWTPPERLLLSALYRCPLEAWIAARTVSASRSILLQRILARTWNERMAAIQWIDEWARNTDKGEQNGE
ncbi:hypothetical protein PAALTS15_17831 [Paenibacillus alvei TS-15]|uniref:Aminoglycoside phosphotransferase domain-containing protein n=1 Tax=Paenibacillus alvei TS-15 TaxID=1117108 RepID=S9TUD4_PAEAL|nr:phosphotransferase [Paenibacillus alvei]EPY05941.1 hypothetical protein PAALTS15_17831 [Paenibacillus alvei TS-15]